MPSNNKIRSEEVQDILTRVPHWMILWGNTIVLLLLVLFFIFTWFIKYPDIITAEATITSQTPPQKEYANFSGKIDTILVADNQNVEKGQVLAMMENTAKLSDVLLLKTTLDTISIQNDIFNFPINKIPLLSLGELSAPFALFQNDYVEYNLNKTLDPYSNWITANRLSENELQLRLKNLENQKKIDKKQFVLSQNEYERNKTLYEKGVISLNEFESKQLEYLEDEKRIKSLDITISQLKQSINNAYKDTKESKINYQIETTKTFKNLIQSYTQLKDAINAWELKYLLKSNYDGKVSFINIWHKNQNVSQRDLLFTIVPTQNNQYFAKVKAPIQNSGKIKPNQDVNIKLLNYPETEYGMLAGKVKTMSAIPNEKGFYLVQVSLNSPLITSYDIKIPFINEMTGNAEIVTEDLRLLERFFYQLRGLFGN